MLTRLWRAQSIASSWWSTRILFTTFTRNLAADIQSNLRKLQAQGCESWEDYRKASRSGRGRLSREERQKIWPVFEEYRRLKPSPSSWTPGASCRIGSVGLVPL